MFRLPPGICDQTSLKQRRQVLLASLQFFHTSLTFGNEPLKEIRSFLLRSSLRRESSVHVVTKAFDLLQQIITLARWWNQLAPHLDKTVHCFPKHLDLLRSQRDDALLLPLRSSHRRGQTLL